MFTIHLEHAPDSIRGELSLFTQEIAPFTFVSSASTKTRDLLWQDIIKIDGISATLIYTDSNELGYSVRTHGYTSYQFTDFDGIQIVTKPRFIIKEICEYLWGKLNPQKSLITHMMEAGLVAACLMSEVYAPLLHKLSRITNIEESELKRKISFICSMHDIGKAHPVFQGKDDKTRDALEEAKLSQQTISKTFRHELYSGKIMSQLLQDNHDANRENRVEIKKIISMHHQKEFRQCTDEDIVNIESNILQKWNEIHAYIYNYIKQVFPFCDLNLLPPDKDDYFVVENAILGILITADWIASNEQILDSKELGEFSSIDDFIDYKSKMIHNFLKKESLSKYTFPEPKGFRDIFPNIQNARPMQMEVEKIVKEHPDIKLLLVESGCGSGKTEAALYAASVLGYSNQASGVYIGLPTGTSAAAIQGRVDDFLSTLGMPSSKLMTSKSFLLRDREESLSFTDISRQRLLYPSAVGTVDQVMTVARKVRYESVRMAGLSSKVLIVDEVHAYDTYMLTVIEKLLELCVKLHVPVILLSATLPSNIKQKLFAAASKKEPDDIRIHSGYPLVSYLTQQNEVCEKQIEEGRADKKEFFQMLPFLQNYQKVADLTISNVQSGGCECVIANTVASAIKTYEEIKKQIKEKEIHDCEIILYHAKMPQKIKEKKAEMILKKFGKKEKEKNRPKKAIVVGTQVLEQSLDIDCDYLVTEICPIDLLLQRLGRHHRHGDEFTIRKEKNLGISVQVLVPETEYQYQSTEMVYEKCYLQATEELLKKQSYLNIPSCTPEVVNAVYENFDVKAQTKMILQKAKADMGNIGTLRSFSLFNDYKNGMLSDSYINVRPSTRPTCKVAIVPQQIYDDMSNHENDIELYKSYVTEEYFEIVKPFLEEEHKEIEKGIFKNVYVFSGQAETQEAIMTLDAEFGLRITKK